MDDRLTLCADLRRERQRTVRDMRTGTHTIRTPESKRFRAALRGFTMIEVMIVVLIIAITSAIVMPMVGNRSDLKLASATRSMLSDLQFAQNLSITSRDNVYIRFGVNTYTVCRRSGATFITLTHPVNNMDFVVNFGTTATTSTLREVSLAKPAFASQSLLAFDSLGAPYLYNESTATKTALSTAATLVLSCGTLNQSLVVEPYTGEISLP